jgi:hypothetical protein
MRSALVSMLPRFGPTQSIHGFDWTHQKHTLKKVKKDPPTQILFSP